MGHGDPHHRQCQMNNGGVAAVLYRGGPNDVLQRLRSRSDIESIIILNLANQEIEVRLLDKLVLFQLKSKWFRRGNLFPFRSEGLGTGLESLKLKSPGKIGLSYKTSGSTSLGSHLIRTIRNAAWISHSSRNCAWTSAPGFILG